MLQKTEIITRSVYVSMSLTQRQAIAPRHDKRYFPQNIHRQRFTHTACLRVIIKGKKRKRKL